MFAGGFLEVELMSQRPPVGNLPNCSLKILHLFLTLTIMFENYHFSVFLLFLVVVYFDVISKSIHFSLSYGSSMCSLCQEETRNH